MCFEIKRFMVRSSTNRRNVRNGSEKPTMSPIRNETARRDRDIACERDEDENEMKKERRVHQLKEDWKHDLYFLDRSEEKWCETPRAVFNALCYFWSYTWYIAKSMLTTRMEISEEEMNLVHRHVRFAVELFESYLSISAPYLQVHHTRVVTRKDAENAMKSLKETLRNSTSKKGDEGLFLLQQMVEARDFSLKVVYDEAHGIVGPTLELNRFCTLLKDMVDGDMLVYMVAWRSELVVHWHSWQPGRNKSERESLRWMSKILFHQEPDASDSRQHCSILSDRKADFLALKRLICFSYKSKKKIREIEKKWETEFHKVAEDFEKREMDFIFGARPRTRRIRDWIKWKHARSEFQS